MSLHRQPIQLLREVNLGEFIPMLGKNNCKKDKNVRKRLLGRLLGMKAVHLGLRAFYCQ